jgi:hypothetical protein
MKSEGRYRVNKNPLLVSILSQMNPVLTFLPYFPKTYSSFIFPSTAMSSKWFLPSRFPTNILY